MKELRFFAWLSYARSKMQEIAEGGDGKKIADNWLRDFAIDMEIARREDETPPRSEFYEGMVAINEALLKQHPKTPSLADSGVQYDPDPAKECWSTILDVIASGRGDVEDLATWRAAELRARGENATVALRGVPGRWLTCVVIRGSGAEEDVTKLVERYKAPGRLASVIRRREEQLEAAGLKEIDLSGHQFLAGQGAIILVRTHEADPAHVRYEVHRLEGPQLKSAGVCPVDALSSTLGRWLAPEGMKKHPCGGDFYRPSSPHAKAGCTKDDCKILSGEAP